MRIVLAIDTVHTDPRSGAAHSMRTLMEWLRDAGHECRVLCSGRFDGIDQDVEQHLARLGVPVTRLPPGRATGGSHRPAVRFELHGVPVTMVLTRNRDPLKPDRAELAQYLRAFDALAERFRPDLVLTYGGGAIVQETLKRAHARGALTVYSLRNYGYEHRWMFDHADHVLTCSPYLARHYKDRIGLRATGIPSPVTWSEVEAPAEGRGFLTFVNPAPHKGLLVFARLAIMLGERRPDIPMLVVQSAIDASLLAGMPEIDFARYPQLVASPSLSEPADIFSVARIVLMPSVFAEPFGRVAVEAMINGVPPLVGDRGALPEVVEGGGQVLPIPDWMTPTIRRLPSEAEIAPWLDAVVRLWDDAEAYAEAAARARAAAARLYSEAVLRPRYSDYFTSLRRGEPLFDTPEPARAGV